MPPTVRSRYPAPRCHDDHRCIRSLALATEQFEWSAGGPGDRPRQIGERRRDMAADGHRDPVPSRSAGRDDELVNETGFGTCVRLRDRFRGSGGVRLGVWEPALGGCSQRCLVNASSSQPPVSRPFSEETRPDQSETAVQCGLKPQVDASAVSRVVDKLGRSSWTDQPGAALS